MSYCFYYFHIETDTHQLLAVFFVPPSLTGALFSFVSAVQVLASVFGYVLYPTIYYHTIEMNWDHSPGISFFVMAALYIFAIPFIL